MHSLETIIKINDKAQAKADALKAQIREQVLKELAAKAA